MPFKHRNPHSHELETAHSILEELVEQAQPPPTSPPKIETPPHANATFVMLARNSELKYVIETLKGIEDRFNRQFHYSYVFLNEEPFTDHFKR
jgi:alpha 1,2-mannosyltransferase